MRTRAKVDEEEVLEEQEAQMSVERKKRSRAFGEVCTDCPSYECLRCSKKGRRVLYRVVKRRR